MSKMAGGKTGPEGYGPDDYCKKAVMNRHGSDILNRCFELDDAVVTKMAIEISI